MSLNTKQARKAAAMRWRNRPIVVCAACGKKHRCVIVPANVQRPAQKRVRSSRAAVP